MALQQELDDAGGAAEVAVDLKDPAGAGRVGVKQVRPGGVIEQTAERFVGFFAVRQAGPEADGPGAGPTGVGAAGGQTAFQRDLAGTPQRRVAAGSEFVAEVERVHVGHVALAGFGFVEILGQLLELAVLADLVGEEHWQLVEQRLAEDGVYVQQLRGGGGVREQLADEGDIHGASFAGFSALAIRGFEGVFGGKRRCGGESSLSVFN